MSIYYNFNLLNVGDTVRLYDKGAWTSDDENEKNDYTFTITSKYSTSNFGRVIRGIVNGESEHFYEDDDWHIEIIQPQSGLMPNGHIAWENQQGQWKTALRVKDDEWIVDNETLTHIELEELLSISKQHFNLSR